MVSVTLTNEEKVRLSVQPRTAAGQAAAIDGAVDFTVQSGDCTIEPIDASHCYIVSGTSASDSTILVSADADLGAGVTTITDTITATVTSAVAVNLGIITDPPVPKLP